MIEIQANGLTFDAEVAGRPGDPMVLMLHGFPQTAYTWRYQLQPLADAGYYVVAPNQRGYSPGARPTAIADYITENLLADARALIEVSGYEQAHVVGHDWGGQLSWLLAALSPSVVTTLTVLSRPHPAAFLNAMANDSTQAGRSRHHKAFQDMSAAGKLVAQGGKRLRELFRNAGVSEVDTNAYADHFLEEPVMNAAINWYRAGFTSSGGQPLAPPDIPAVDVPTLYIWGDADSTVGRMAAEGTADYVSGAYRFVELAGIDHFVTDQAGDQVTDLLLAHLNFNGEQ